MSRQRMQAQRRRRRRRKKSLKRNAKTPEREDQRGKIPSQAAVDQRKASDLLMWRKRRKEEREGVANEEEGEDAR